ncbi:MAG: KEOPS complex subunit Cgi121 [Candidatus Bathyarchaeia archaeon]|nr:hypothetical protein [Candidatus Bathyarchaeota archaeon]
MAHRARIKGSDLYLVIGGFRDVQVNDVESLLRRIGEMAAPCTFQIFDADRVAGWEHLFMAAVNAYRAFKAGSALSRSLAMEILLYASCRDQISEALEVLGVSKSTKNIALLVTSKEEEVAKGCFERVSKLLGAEDDSLLLVSEEKFRILLDVYGVTVEELEAVGGDPHEALTSLLIERGALLAVQR